MTALEAVFWDVDGTLADTEMEGHRPAFNQAFLELGLPFHWNKKLYADLLETISLFDSINLIFKYF